MELLTASDLVVTASLALLLSVLVAKLVSMAMASDPNNHSTHQPVVTLQQERLLVQKAQSESRVEFIGPIQVSTNVETEQNRGEDDEEENKVESELDVMIPENIAVEFGVSNVGVLREEHVAAEEEEVTGTNEESEEQRKTEDCEEQRKTECVEDCKEQMKTEEIIAEASSVKESEEQERTEDCMEQRKTEEIAAVARNCVKESEEQRKTEDCMEQRKTEENAIEAIGVKESEKQRKTENIEDCKEQGKTEETTAAQPIDEMGIPIEESNVKEKIDDGVDDDDDWEGIERSELEKLFMMATEFVVGGGLGSEVQMELYGLHKIATEGPCREPQPMPLKLNARAKWNSWQKLGNMSPDVAMERYIGILSDKVPGWMKDSSSAGMSEHERKGSEVSESVAPDLSTSLSHQQIIITERKLEQESGAKDYNILTETDLENNVKK